MVPPTGTTGPSSRSSVAPSYTFNDRLTGTFNVRRDGSSRFGTDNRYGTFPSASVLWRVSEESFMDNFHLLSNLAVRASYGLTGNQQNLGNFASRGLFGGGANYFDQPGIAPTQLANPALRWEKTKQSTWERTSRSSPTASPSTWTTTRRRPRTSW